jgi:hypothetical protein
MRGRLGLVRVPAHASYLVGRRAHYLLTVKANQSTLPRQLKPLPWTDVPVG